MIFINHTEYMDGRVIAVDIKGALDSTTSVDFEEYMNKLISKRNIYIILNSEGLEYVSSGGIGVILYIQKKIIASKGLFILCNIHEEIFTLYKLLGFDKIIKTASSKDEALQIMEKQLNLISDLESNTREPAALKDDTASSVIDSGIESQSRADIQEQGEKAFDNPIILECAECQSMIRVKKSGKYICPDCRAEFFVDADQTVIF